MEDHIQELLNRYQYSEEVKEAAAFRMLFIGEDAKQLMQQIYHMSGPETGRIRKRRKIEMKITCG